jgi:hypothetical protein
MKWSFFAIVSGLALALYGCGGPVSGSRYMLKLPELPSAWEELLGNPHWQLEWINDSGRKEKAAVRKGIEISLFPTQANAVFAAPYWPEKGIAPGVFKPAGAIFPFDTDGKSLILSWQGGVDAVLFRELAIACQESAGSASGSTSVPRLPDNFNWPRFRQLFADPSLNEEIRADPWLADWQAIAEKIVQSGFDKRRLVPETRVNMKIPVNSGPWIGASPFAPPLVFDAAPSFPARPKTDTWVSAEGLLRCNETAWMFYLGDGE